jgi:hypothetical protein
MGFFKTKQRKIFAVIIICLVVSVFLNINYAHQNNKYEKYFKEQISNILRPMGADINGAKGILVKANSSGYISKEDLNYLYNYHQSFILGMQDLVHLYNMTRNESYRSMLPTSHYYALYTELFSFDRDVQSKYESKYKITNEDKVFFNQMRNMTSEIANVFGNDFYNWDFSIANDKWIEVIKKIDYISVKIYD